MKIKVYCFFKSVLFFCVFFLIKLPFFSKEIINPVCGVWANKQMLVLDIPAGSAAYYSFNGNDPENSGFAYDGPVLLDVSGSVYLNIVIINPDGEKITQTIMYSVSDAALPFGKTGLFIKNAVKNGFINYQTGDVYSIPEELEYSFGDVPEVFEKGKDLSISKDMIIHRYLPCTVTDGNEKWRFIIQVNPSEGQPYTKKDIPFKVTDWETVNFIDKNFIYKIDDGSWEQYKSSIKLDRKKTHVFSWQKINYDGKNPVNFCVFPPKPQIISSENKEGSILISAKDFDGYKFAIIDDNKEPIKLYDLVKIDTFSGDFFKGTASAGIYYDSVYQGKIVFSYSINKRRPHAPIIIPSERGLILRQNVQLHISNVSGYTTFVSVAGPVEVDKKNDFVIEEIFNNLKPENFQKFSEKTINLFSSEEGAAAYKVCAYAADTAGNKSRVTEYTVIIDQCDYYLNGNIAGKKIIVEADGTKEKPFSSFEQIIPLLKENNFVRILASGRINMPEGVTVINSDFRIDGIKNAVLNFPSGASLVVKNSVFSVSNSVIYYSQSLEDRSGGSLFKAKNAVMNFENTDISVSFNKNGTLIDAENSEVNINESKISSSAPLYSSVVSAVESKISVLNSHVASSAGTAVVFSVQGGTFDMNSSFCNIFGFLGRAVELFDTKSRILNNHFFADLKKSSKNNVPVYTDKMNFHLEMEKNTISGF